MESTLDGTPPKATLSREDPLSVPRSSVASPSIEAVLGPDLAELEGEVVATVLAGRRGLRRLYATAREAGSLKEVLADLESARLHLERAMDLVRAEPGMASEGGIPAASLDDKRGGGLQNLESPPAGATTENRGPRRPLAAAPSRRSEHGDLRDTA